jgi:hypothetical protein
MHKLLLTAALASVLAVGPAYGQSDFWAGVTADVIGQTIANSGARNNAERACLSGNFGTSERQLTRIRASAQQTMSAYATLARSAEAFDASSVFHRREQSWGRASDGAKFDSVEAITDPVMREVSAPLGEPAQFVRAGDGRSAAGLWIIRGDEGQIIGSYLGVFRRGGGRCMLARLEIDERDQEPAPLNPYCHSLGDVDQYLAEIAAQEANAAPKPDGNVADAGSDPAQPESTATAPQ